MSKVDVSTIISRLEAARGRVRAKVTEVTGRSPSPFLREIASQGVIGTISSRVSDGGILQGRGPIISSISNVLGARTETKSPPETKSEEKPKEPKKEKVDAEAYGSFK